MWPVWLLLTACLAPTQMDMEDEDDIPTVGRPADLPFSGASGTRFRIEARVEPKTLRAGQPFTLTLIIQASGEVRHPPRPIDLNEVPEFKLRFYIEKSPPPPEPDPRARHWEFSYTLKPRRADVAEVPEVPFVYFNPFIKPASNGFMTDYTKSIPLKVREAEKVETPLKEPEQFFNLARSPRLLASEQPWRWPWWVFPLLLFLPPVLSLTSYAAWRQLYPDAARLAQRRRSRAARLALNSLSELRRSGKPIRAQADQVAQAVADYLRQRLDFPPGELTPAEAHAHLRSQGLDPEVSEHVSQLLQTCDEIRFGSGANREGLPQTAVEVILAVEFAT